MELMWYPNHLHHHSNYHYYSSCQYYYPWDGSYDSYGEEEQEESSTNCHLPSPSDIIGYQQRKRIPLASPGEEMWGHTREGGVIISTPLFSFFHFT